jgi:hypothetical protein
MRIPQKNNAKHAARQRRLTQSSRQKPMRRRPKSLPADFGQLT